MDYRVRRVLQGLFTLVFVISLSFFLYRLLPSSPVEIMRLRLMREAATSGGTVDLNRINRLVEIYTGIQPDAPLHVQYYRYIRDILLHGDFGRSIWQNEPVFDVLFKAMPWSVFISIWSLSLAWATNILLGAFMAYKEGSVFDNIMTIYGVIGSSIPYYVAAILFLSYLAYDFGWFPTGGRYNPDTTIGFNVPFMVSVIYHAALPVMSGYLLGFAAGALSMRGNAIRVMGEDYIRVARLRGLRESRIASQYVARNSMLPAYTSIMIGIASMFSSSIILEQIFRYPGVGWYTFGALQNRDFPLLMGSLIFFTTITILGILIADFTYGLIDPRITAGEEGHESY